MGNLEKASATAPALVAQGEELAFNEALETYNEAQKFDSKVEISADAWNINKPTYAHLLCCTSVFTS